jgi:glycerophosphoryl diester phosphodiesterase
VVLQNLHVRSEPSLSQPYVVAHRGASAHRAEHTLAAYALALEQGADALECDVRLTRDGHLVCVHDRTVNRTSDGRGVVSGLTLAALSGLDYGHWHDELPESADELVGMPTAVPSAPKHGRGLLTLDDLLGLVTDVSPDAKLFIETKHPVRYGGLVETKLIAMLARHGLAKPATKEDSRVVAMSFSSLAMRRVRDNAPHLPTVLLLDKLRLSVADGSLPQWADMAGPGVRLLRADPGFVRRARDHGHDVYCWTQDPPHGLIPVDNPDDVLFCRSIGVKYFATNSPASMRRVLDAL